MTIDYQQGVNLMIGSFDMWFGTADGDALRQWCIAQGWPLVWSHNPIDSMWECGVAPDSPCETPPDYQLSHGVDLANARFLDPEVQLLVSSGRNCSSGSEFEQARHAFALRWAAVAAIPTESIPKDERKALLQMQWTIFLQGDPDAGLL